MADLNLSGNSYKSYASVAEADQYLAADAGQAVAWAARDDDAKARALISATRYMAGLAWINQDIPAYDAPGDAVRDVCAILAALVAEDPDLLDGASPASNVKRVKAGSAEVEFLGPTGARRIPDRLARMLEGLLDTSTRSKVSLPYNGGVGKSRCSGTSCENGLTGPYT